VTNNAGVIRQRVFLLWPDWPGRSAQKKENKVNTETTTQATKKPTWHAPFSDRPDDGFVREKDLLPVISVSSSTLWRRVNAGLFPKPIKLSERVTVWRVGVIRAWLSSVSGTTA